MRIPEVKDNPGSYYALYLRESSHIPRRKLKGRKRYYSKESASPISNRGLKVEYEEFELEHCTFQPLKGQDRKVLDEGLRDLESYSLWTQTEVTGVVENSTQMGDQVYLSDVNSCGWYTIVTVKRWTTGVIPHYQCVVVKEAQK